MLNYKKLVMATCTLTLFQGCFWNKEAETATKQPAASLMVVNVLSKELYDDAHIKGSTLLELENMDDAIASWNKETPVVFYCSNYQCTGSSHAAREFKKAGFNHVYAYEGGMAEWYQLGKTDASYATEGPATQEYLAQVIPAPEHTSEEVTVISSADLKDKMAQAGLL